jgi:hypothetical protein
MRKMCMVNGCFQRASGWGAACRTHWRAVPKADRTRLMQLWRRNEPSREEARLDVLEALRRMGER